MNQWCASFRLGVWSVLYRCDRKLLAERIVHSNGAVYTSLIDLILNWLYEVRGGGFVLLDPLAKQLKQVGEKLKTDLSKPWHWLFWREPKLQPDRPYLKNRSFQEILSTLKSMNWHKIIIVLLVPSLRRCIMILSVNQRFSSTDSN